MLHSRNALGRYELRLLRGPLGGTVGSRARVRSAAAVSLASKHLVSDDATLIGLVARTALTICLLNHPHDYRFGLSL